MARRDDLELKIRALVEGIQEVQQLEKEITDLQREAGQEIPDNSSRFRRSLRETQRTAERVKKEMFSLRGAMVGLASAGAAGAVIQRTIAATAALDEQADTAGINVERFPELTKSFSDMAGVAESTTAGALRRFNRRLGLARQGTGAAADTLERLNIDLTQETGPALDEAVRKLADMESGADRAAAASQLFGEDAGPQLAAALAQGQRALEETIEKLREQGRIMSNESAESARKLNDRYNELADTIGTTFKRAVVGGTDAILDLFDVQEKLPLLQEDLEDLQQRRDRILENLDSSPWPEQLRDELQSVNQEMLDIQKRMQDIREGNDTGSDRVDPFGVNLDASALDEALKEASADLNRRMSIIKEQAREDVAELGAIFGGAEGPSIDQSGAPGFRAVDDQTAQMLENAKRGGELFRQTRTDLENYNREIAEYKRLLDDGAISQETYNRAVAQAKEELKEAGKQAGETGEEFSEFAREAKRNIQDELGDTLNQFMRNNFEDIGDAWRDMIFRMVSEAAAAELSGALFGEGEGFSGGAIGSILDAFSGSGSGSTGTGTGSSPAAASGGSSGGSGWANVIGSVIGAFFHEGGVVGQGGRPGMVPAGTWAGAPRMHSGGVAGLRRDEVPIIAKRGEEVLTEEDPRHRNNGAGVINQVNMTVKTPDAETFRKSRSAITRDMRSGISRKG